MIKRLTSAVKTTLRNARMLLQKGTARSILGMFVDSNGKFKVDFDYADISENSLEYEQTWKEKHNIN